MSEFDRWIPAVVRDGDGAPEVDWFLRGRARFDGTTFGDVVARSMRRPFNFAFARTTPLGDLESIAAGSTTLPLSGIVAHMSRCGSTLVARMLGASGAVRVVAEAHPIEAMLNLPGTDEERVRRLRAMVAIFGRPGTERETHYVLKLDAWSTRHLPLFERAFPGVPWIFSYRDPLEVVVSHLRGFSLFMSAANAPRTLEMGVAEAMHMPRPEFCARVLHRVMEDAIAAGAAGERLVDYAELPGAVETRVAPYFGLPTDDATSAAMRAATTGHAKRPSDAFVPDVAEKRASADEGVVAATARFADATYARLTALRRG